MAERLAGRAMQTLGFVPATMIASSANGVVFLSPDHQADDSAKDKFAWIAHLVCIAHAATAAVLVLESWIAPVPLNATENSFVPPSESPDRREVVVLAGESCSGYKQTILPIVRTSKGRFQEFGERESLQSEYAAGRFAGILPATSPTRAEQDRASLVLAGMGISVSGLNRQPYTN